MNKNMPIKFSWTVPILVLIGWIFTAGAIYFQIQSQSKDVSDLKVRMATVELQTKAQEVDNKYISDIVTDIRDDVKNLNGLLYEHVKQK